MKTIMVLVCVLAVSLGSAVASAPINGYGKARFGDSLQTVKKAYPDVLKDSILPNGWKCQRPVPYLMGYPEPEITFSFHNGQLDAVYVVGTLTDPNMFSVLKDKYGDPISSGEEWTVCCGNTSKAVWVDAAGNQLTITYVHKSFSTFLHYLSADKVKRKAKIQADMKKEKQKKL